MSKPHLKVEVLRSPRKKTSSITPDANQLINDEEGSDDDDVASINYINRDLEGDVSDSRPSIRSTRNSQNQRSVPVSMTFVERLTLVKGLFLPYIVPLFLVYLA